MRKKKGPFAGQAEAAQVVTPLQKVPERFVPSNARNHPLGIVLGKLGEVRPSGAGFAACCPAHDDRNPSLHVEERDDGGVLLYCHAGCTVEAICSTIGIRTADLFATAQRADARIAATYDYRDELNNLLFQVVRYKPKSFRQRRPNESRNGWLWNLKGVRRVLYRLPELLSASPSELVFIVEGEKDADALANKGVVATTNPQGAGKWKCVDSSPLRGRRVVVLPDNDVAGRMHAEDVARHLKDSVKDIRIVELPGLPQKGDVSDWLTEHAIEELLQLVDRASQPSRVLEESADSTQVACLLEIARANSETFHDAYKIGYATVRLDGHYVTHAIRSRPYRHLLTRMFYKVHGRIPCAHALNDAVNAIEGEALFDGLTRTVAVRLIPSEKEVFLDLGDSSCTCLQITQSGWQAVECPDVRFRRPPGLRAFPIPQCGGSLVELLREFVNVGSDEDFVLIVAWILAAFMPAGPYPILVVNGEQGSAKSTTSRVLRELTDPCSVPLRSPPRSEHDLVIAAHNARVLALDNVSFMPGSLSDALCRIATGGGFAVRTLFTDTEETQFEGARPILLNGIGDFATRPDLLDRVIHVTLPPIPEQRRIDEASFWGRFRAAQPLILGAILDAVAVALRNLQATKLEQLPRMADFARWVVSAESGLGWRSGTFLDAYCRNRGTANELALSSSPVAEVIQTWPVCKWEGTATELLQELEMAAPDVVRKAPGWPRDPSHLGSTLRRVAPNLRVSGINIEFGAIGRGNGRRRMITIRKSLPSAVAAVPTVPDSSLRMSGGSAGDSVLFSSPSPNIAAGDTK